MKQGIPRKNQKNTSMHSPNILACTRSFKLRKNFKQKRREKEKKRERKGDFSNRKNTRVLKM